MNAAKCPGLSDMLPYLAQKWLRGTGLLGSETLDGQNSPRNFAAATECDKCGALKPSPEEAKVVEERDQAEDPALKGASTHNNC